jgi:hypothetical protein
MGGREDENPTIPGTLGFSAAFNVWNSLTIHR